MITQECLRKECNEITLYPHVHALVTWTGAKKTVICDNRCQHKSLFLLTRNRDLGASVVRNGSWLVR